MPRHLQRDLDNLKKDTLILGSMVSSTINKAIIALVDRRIDLSEEVINGDDAIDEKEVAIEEECLKILALHQPVAADLRFIITILKVNSDLERMGDLAVNIAERASYLSSIKSLGLELDFPRMVECVQRMVKESLNSLINMDTRQARKVLSMDDEVDDINREMYVVLQKEMKENSDSIERAVHLLSTSRHLERIADLSTNIAEDVVFMVEGELIRHRTEDYAE
ncbi:MAG: phosphate signaling complex protein PhoU [Nitrospinota bacterium]|nr:phosphate signaling complex protein PhoU [Nitrospinota bacterium]